MVAWSPGRRPTVSYRRRREQHLATFLQEEAKQSSAVKDTIHNAERISNVSSDYEYGTKQDSEVVTDWEKQQLTEKHQGVTSLRKYALGAVARAITRAGLDAALMR